MLSESIAAALHEALHIPLNSLSVPSQISPIVVNQTDTKPVPESIIYIGGESLGLTNLLITHSTSSVRPLLRLDQKLNLLSRSIHMTLP
jgi:hypothetical protein